MAAATDQGEAATDHGEAEHINGQRCFALILLRHIGAGGVPVSPGPAAPAPAAGAGTEGPFVWIHRVDALNSGR